MQIADYGTSAFGDCFNCNLPSWLGTSAGGVLLGEFLKLFDLIGRPLLIVIGGLFIHIVFLFLFVPVPLDNTDHQ